MAQRKKHDFAVFTVSDTRTAVARMLVLARDCEVHIGRSEKSPQGNKTLKKMMCIANALKPLSGSRVKWLKDIHIGMCVSNVHSLYNRFCEGEFTKKELISRISTFWNDFFGSPPTPNQLRQLSNVTSKKIKVNRGAKETAMINVGRVFHYKNKANKPSSYIQRICQKYKRDVHKMAGRVHGDDPGISHQSFTTGTRWLSLLDYYFKNLMSLSPKDYVRIVNHIGELLTKQKGVAPTD